MRAKRKRLHLTTTVDPAVLAALRARVAVTGETVCSILDRILSVFLEVELTVPGHVPARKGAPVKHGRVLHKLDGIVATVDQHAGRLGLSTETVYRRIRKAKATP